MARTNLHELATRLLEELAKGAPDGEFHGKLRLVAMEAGLNSVRSAEAVKLLESLGRIEVKQRGRRGRDTIIAVRSTEPVVLSDAEASLPSRSTRKTPRLDYSDLGGAVIDRLLELGRNDALRAAQVEAFASAGEKLRERERELAAELEATKEREAELRIKLRTAEEALQRAEENIRRTLEPQGRLASASRQPGARTAEPQPVPDDDTRAVLDILRSGHG